MALNKNHSEGGGVIVNNTEKVKTVRNNPRGPEGRASSVWAVGGGA